MDSYPENSDPYGEIPGPLEPIDCEPFEYMPSDAYSAPDVVPTDDRVLDGYDIESMRFLVEPTPETREEFGELVAALRETCTPAIEHRRFLTANLGDNDDSLTYTSVSCTVRGKSTPGHPIDTSCTVEVSVWNLDPTTQNGNLRGRTYRGGAVHGDLGDTDYQAAFKHLAIRLDTDEFAYMQKAINVASIPTGDPNRTYAASILMDSAPASVPVCELTTYTMPDVYCQNGTMISFKWEETNDAFKMRANGSPMATQRLSIRLPDGNTMSYCMNRDNAEELFALTFGNGPARSIPAGINSFMPHELGDISERREAGVLKLTDGGLAAFNAQLQTGLQSGIWHAGE